MTMSLKENKYLNKPIYESKFWKTISWNLRWWSMKYTYEANFYLNEKWHIIGLKSEKINSGEIVWEKTDSKIEMWIWNIVISILESWKQAEYYNNIYTASFQKEKKYETINEFMKELNIAYKYKLEKILNPK